MDADELMHERLMAAGQQWRNATSTVDVAVPVDVTPTAPRSTVRRRLPLILSAAAIVIALVSGGVWFATRPSHQTPAPATGTAGPVDSTGLRGTDWTVFEVSRDTANSSDSYSLTGLSASLQIGLDGSVTGNDTCNHFSGNATVSGAVIHFGAMASTAIGCLDPNTQKISSTIDAVLTGDVGFVIQDSGSDNSLFLTKDGVGAIILYGKKPAPQPTTEANLRGSWSLTAYGQQNNGVSVSSGSGSATSTLSGFSSSLTFDGNGHFSTTERCYSTGGDVSFAGNVVTFSAVHNTGSVPCPQLPSSEDVQAEQEMTQTVDNTLTGPVNVTLDADRQHLTITNGGLSLTYERTAQPK